MSAAFYRGNSLGESKRGGVVVFQQQPLPPPLYEVNSSVEGEAPAPLSTESSQVVVEVIIPQPAEVIPGGSSRKTVVVKEEVEAIGNP